MIYVEVLKMGIVERIRNFVHADDDESDNHESDAKRVERTLVKVKLPGCSEFVPLGKDQYTRVYKDDIGPRLLIVIDEAAELLTPSGGRSQEDKEEDAEKAEAVTIMKSITQLGRSSGIHMIICTQRNDATIIPGVIQNNPLSLDCKLRVMRNVEK
jgi:DNA segregation ATPase FtsK/SpoIIIE-like protein